MAAKRTTPEREFQRRLVEALRKHGYLVNHTRPATMPRDGSYQTPTTAKGWPDLLAVRPPRVLAIEVKADPGRVSNAQAAWLSAFARVPCCRAWVLRPSDPWDTIIDWLARPMLAPGLHGFVPVGDPVVVEAHARRPRRNPQQA